MPYWSLRGCPENAVKEFSVDFRRLLGIASRSGVLVVLGVLVGVGVGVGVVLRDEAKNMVPLGKARGIGPVEACSVASGTSGSAVADPRRERLLSRWPAPRKGANELD